MASTALNRLRSLANLREVWREYWYNNKDSAPDIDGITPKIFNDNLSKNLNILRAELSDTYDYSSLRRRRSKKRPDEKTRDLYSDSARQSGSESYFADDLSESSETWDCQRRKLRFHQGQQWSAPGRARSTECSRPATAAEALGL